MLLNQDIKDPEKVGVVFLMLGIGLKFSQDDIIVTAFQMSVGRTGHDGASMGFIICVEIRWEMSDQDRELGPPVESSARSSVRVGFGAAARASI